MFKSLPVNTEIPIIQVDCCFTDKIVSKKIIVVVSGNNDARRTRKLDIEIENLVELGIWLVQLVLISFIVDHCATLDSQVWIRLTAYVVRSEIKSLKHVQIHCCWHSLQQVF
jgi:hypothetical protein